MFSYRGYGFANYPYQNLNDLNLDYVLSVAKKAVETLRDLDGYADRIVELENAIKKLENGDLTPELMKSILDLVQSNIIDLVGNMVKFVFFGLTDAGHFVAYIPDPWKELVFRTTGYDIEIEGVTDYGRLVLLY